MSAARSAPADFDYPSLKPALLAALRHGPYSEYELLTRLAAQPPFASDRSDPLSLFHQHFLLFHSLYRLQAELWAAQEGDLRIGPLRIELLAYRAGQSGALTEPDPLRAYYLELSQLEHVGHDEVRTLLDDFWALLARRDTRQRALELLGLKDPVDNKTIKRRYRELVMTHHPDRGGDTARLQLLNAAVAELLPAGGSNRR